MSVIINIRIRKITAATLIGAAQKNFYTDATTRRGVKVIFTLCCI